MARRKRRSLNETLQRIKATGLREPPRTLPPEDQLPLLTDRIPRILGILRAAPKKATEMVYLVMYDITDDRVRRAVADYLLREGSVRIQKSVYLLRSDNRRFEEIHQTLREVNDAYANTDSIILVPVNSSDVRAMQLIGQNVDIQLITDPPNTLFF